MRLSLIPYPSVTGDAVVAFSAAHSITALYPSYDARRSESPATNWDRWVHTGVNPFL